MSKKSISYAVAVTAGLAMGGALGSGCTGSTSTGVEPPAEEKSQGVLVSQTFTSSLDWILGESNGVNDDTTGQLQMTPGLSLFETPFIWIPNSTDRTVTKINTVTREVEGTFSLVNAQGEDCYNPSRTTVDIEGNVWVGCRGNSSYVNGLSGKSVPDEVDDKVVKLAKDDGRVLLSIHVGYGPRAMALDANNHVWIGCSVDDTVWEIDGETGECFRGDAPECPLPAVPVGDFPYGAVVDQRGHLWVQNMWAHTVSEVDTATGQVLGTYGPWSRDGCTDLYGIAVDQMNDIWVGGWVCDDIIKIKGVTGRYFADGQTYNAGDLLAWREIGGERTRGVAVDVDGNVWAASSSTDTATKVNNVTLELEEVAGVGDAPIGVGVDAYGNAWIVNQGGDSVTWVNGLDARDTKTIAVGDGPYTYSDMLGMALRTITMRAEGFASWKVKIDSGTSNPKWGRVNWSADEPESTEIRVRVRTAHDEADLGTQAWGPFLLDPGQVECATGDCVGQWLELEARFYSTGTGASPILYDLTVYWEE